MLAGVEFLLREGQNFARRADQYKKCGCLPNKLTLKRYVVKHRITNEKFLMKVVKSSMPLELKM